jgi:2-dehydropantoate 2-reductase
MKIAVMGAGAVGCYYGFKLARAGHDVMLIGRPQHVEAIERHGLRLETQTFDEHIRVSASTEGSAVQGAQLVLFCVKSTDTESGAAAIKPHLMRWCCRCKTASRTRTDCARCCHRK